VNTANKTYGTVSPQRQKAISGLEFVKGLVSGALPLNTIAQTLGYDVVEAESGSRVGMAEGRVTDAKSRLLAHGTTTCPIFPSGDYILYVLSREAYRRLRVTGRLSKFQGKNRRSNVSKMRSMRSRSFARTWTMRSRSKPPTSRNAISKEGSKSV
jgi:hypothetical protein